MDDMMGAFNKKQQEKPKQTNSYWGGDGGFDDNFDNLDNVALSEHTESQCGLQSSRIQKQESEEEDEFERDEHQWLDFDDEPVIINKKKAGASGKTDVRMGLESFKEVK